MKKNLKSHSLFNQDEIRLVERNKRTWSERSYGKTKERATSFQTLSGIHVDPLYTPSDIPDSDYSADLGFPGEEPYTRGVYPTMYRSRLWTMRQLAGFGIPEDTNERLKFLLAQGATGVNITFDYPTLRGYNSDDPIAEGDAGRGGVAIDSLSDMEALFSGIPVNEVSVSLVTCNPIVAVPLISMYFAAAEKRGLKPAELAGTTQNDFLMETAVTVAPEVLPPKHSFKLSCDVIEHCTQHAPKWNPISYAGYNYREAGATAIQELAFVFSHAIACIEEMIRRGWGVDVFTPRLSFFLSAHNDFFEEIAKYRAARRIWYKIMKERFKAESPRSHAFRFHVQTAGVSLTAQQPLNNISRAAYQALAAVLGGAQSLHIDGYDEALCTPTQQAALTALRTQQILQHETNVVSTVDPLGGSYYVEHLTNEIEKRVWDYVEKIDKMGGIVLATEKGWVHGELSKSAFEYHNMIESGEMKVIGVNCFTMKEEEATEIFVTPETIKKQEVKLDKLRRERDDVKVQRTLDRIREGCKRTKNVVPLVTEAVKSQTTLGEITNVFKEEFGVWKTPLI